MLKILYILIITISFWGCSSNTKKQAQLTHTEIVGETQGTYYRVVFEDNNSIQKQNIDSVLHAFDLEFSNYIPNSTISQFNNNSLLSSTLSKSFIYFIKKSFYFYEQTHGAFDITCAPIVNAWKFGFKNDSLLPTQTKIDSLLEYVGMNKLRLQDLQLQKTNQNIEIISNAIAQGYSVDILADFFDLKGIKNYLIDIGGEIKSKGKNGSNKLWTIGINTPKEGVAYNEFKEIVSLNNQSLATSGNYRKFYKVNGKKYSHTINPKTGYPVQHNLLSTTIITKECIDADALATACMVMGLERSILFVETNKKYDAIFIYEKNDSLKVWSSLQN